MNTKDDIKNPASSRIRRIENGWILSIGDCMSTYPVEYTFTSAETLANFIQQNFRLPPKEDKP